MVIPARGSSNDATVDDFRLSAAQMVFLINAEAAIERAEAANDDQFFRDLVDSAEYRALFGDMSIDQALDRYEAMTLR